MRTLATRLFGVLLLTALAATAAYATDWDSTQVKIPNCQNPAAVPFALPGDSVEGIRGIVIAKDTIQTAYGFWIELNQSPAGNVPWTGIEVFTGSAATPSPSGALAHGDSISLNGKLTEFSGVGTEIIAKDGTGFGTDLVVRKITTNNNIPNFHDDTVHNLSELIGTAEQWEGMLVRHNGTMRIARKIGIGGFTPGSNCIVVDSVLCPPSSPGPCDSLFIDTASLAGIATPDVGAFLTYVQGPVRQTTRGYRILCRNADDLGDKAPPTVTDAYSVSNDSIRVQFDRPVNTGTTGAGALNPANYSFQSLASVTGGIMDGLQAVILRVSTTLTPGQQEKLTVNGIASTGTPPLTMTTPNDRYFTWGLVTIQQIQGPSPDSLALVPCRDVANFLNPPVGPQRVTYRGTCTNILPGGSPIYFIEDAAGGARSGVAVFAPPAALIKGNKYLMVSTIQEFGSGGPNASITEMTGVSYLRNEGAGTIPAPPVKTVHVLADTSCDATQSADTHEDWEGVLVQVTNVKITSVGRTFTNNFDVAGPYPACSDTILIDNDAGTAKFAHTTFQPSFGQILQVTGVVHSSFGIPRLEPRDSTDIVKLNDNAVDPRAPARVTFSVYPNPARVQRVSFGLPRRSNVELAVFDVAGRQVRWLARGDFEAGTYNNIAWDGTDASGQSVGAGLFFYRLKVNGETYKLSGVRLK